MKTAVCILLVLVLLLLGVALSFVNYFSSQFAAAKTQRSYLNALKDEENVLFHSSRRTAASRYVGGTSACTMQTCFNVSKCVNGFKVYVYPTTTSDRVSPAYKTILNVIRDSSYYTHDPTQACLFVPNLDTMDRDPRSRDFVRGLARKIRALPHWNNGENHLLFNMYSGKFPRYDADLFFDYGRAILAQSSASDLTYRIEFDVSFPLLGSKHTQLGKTAGMMSDLANFLPVHRKYLLVFKGKRYMVGYGSETRNNLFKIDNSADIIMLTTCRHMGASFEEYERCDKDNQRYKL